MNPLGTTSRKELTPSLPRYTSNIFNNIIADSKLIGYVQEFIDPQRHPLPESVTINDGVGCVSSQVS